MIRPAPLPSRSLPLILAVLLLAACATRQAVPETGTPPAPIPVTPPEAQPPETAPETPPPVITPQQPPPEGYPKTLKDSGAGPAVQALVRQAQQSRSAGKPDVALGQLERALRIEPRNPFIWQALADAHLQLQQADQAESAAQKSTSLGHGNPYLEAGNWRVIAAARRLKGDSAGAQHATSRADELSSGTSVVP